MRGRFKRPVAGREQGANYLNRTSSRNRSQMATPIRKQRSRVMPSGSNRPQTPLRALALNLTQAARAALTEPYMLTVEHRQIHLRRLPRELDGLRIVHLSDIHLSAF